MTGYISAKHSNMFDVLLLICTIIAKKWIEYPVFHLSFAKSDYTQFGMLEKNIEKFLIKAELQYGVTPDIDEINLRFYSVLEAAHEKTGRRVVVLIDEYDKPLLDVMNLERYTTDKDGNKILLEDYNRSILKGFYGVFKAADRHLKFVMLTGVTKFSQTSVFSGFNQPKDISMDKRYDALCGITKEEMLRRHCLQALLTGHCERKTRKRPNVFPIWNISHAADDFSPCCDS